MAYRNAQTIDDLLADPLIQKVMRADHVEPQALRSLLDWNRPPHRRLAARGHRCRSGRISAGAACFVGRCS